MNTPVKGSAPTRHQALSRGGSGEARLSALGHIVVCNNDKGLTESPATVGLDVPAHPDRRYEGERTADSTWDLLRMFELAARRGGGDLYIGLAGVKELYERFGSRAQRCASLMRSSAADADDIVGDSALAVCLGTVESCEPGAAPLREAGVPDVLASDPHRQRDRCGRSI